MEIWRYGSSELGDAFSQGVERVNGGIISSVYNTGCREYVEGF